MFLCYNKDENKLYHGEIASTEDIIFTSYDDTGWKNNDILVDGSGLSFHIYSNFGYKSKSYLYFTATFYGQSLYDYEKGRETEKLLPLFSTTPTPCNWCDLFYKMENIFDQKESWNSNSLTRFLIRLNSELENLDDKDLEPKANSIIRQISTTLYGRTAISLAHNPLVEATLIQTCKIGLNIIRKNMAGCGFDNLLEPDRKTCMDTIYYFLRQTNHEHIIFE